MHVVLLRVFRQCLASLEGSNRHLRLERERVVQLFPSYYAPCDGSHAALLEQSYHSSCCPIFRGRLCG